MGSQQCFACNVCVSREDVMVALDVVFYAIFFNFYCRGAATIQRTWVRETEPEGKTLSLARSHVLKAGL